MWRRHLTITGECIGGLREAFYQARRRPQIEPEAVHGCELPPAIQAERDEERQRIRDEANRKAVEAIERKFGAGSVRLIVRKHGASG
jgi:hypothetical protein